MQQGADSQFAGEAECGTFSTYFSVIWKFLYVCEINYDQVFICSSIVFETNYITLNFKSNLLFLIVFIDFLFIQENFLWK